MHSDRLISLYEFQQTLVDVICKRFPQAPLALMADIHQITHPVHLRLLIVATIDAKDLTDVERMLKQAASSSGSDATHRSP